MTQRLNDAILGQDIAYAQGRQNKMLDLRYGGQMGFAPQLNQLISNQPYVSRPLIALLLEAPRGFRDLPNEAYWVETLRALVELRAIRITGLDSTLNVTVDDTAPIGGAGEFHQDFTNVTRERSSPVFSWAEAYGLPVKSFLEGWIGHLMMDANSKVANVATLLDIGARPDAMLADYYSMSVAFIEPDPTHTKVVRSWLCTNMFPQGRIAASEGSRDLQQAGAALTYDVNFTATTQVGLGVDFYCQQLLDNINILGASPQQQMAYTQQAGQISEGGQLVESRLQGAGHGYKDQVESLPNSQLQV